MTANPDNRTSVRIRHPFYCNRTGVPLGHIDLSLCAGHVPYMSHWNEMIAYHPLFSLTPNKLIDYMMGEWNRLAKEIINEQASDKEELLLRVGFTALLHNLGSIRRDGNAVGLPEMATVQSNLASLLALSTWKNLLDSKRFSFPELHISRLNDNSTLSNIHDYLNACWDQKKAYELGINDVQEQERARIAEKAVIAIRNSFYKPVSKKLLWTWVYAQLPPKWKGDAWLATIFLSPASAISEWEPEEIDLFDDIIQSSIPMGSTVSFAVRERLAEIQKISADHHEAFTIEEDGLQFIEQLRVELTAAEEPKQEDFKNKAEFFVARAKWQLAHRTEYQKAKSTTMINAQQKHGL